ncbi:MAG: host-nuclease inhibitor Gam family protein [Prevotellaceae bacterium]|jgi:phage host-nuclease inhibitor protein Gam|nr:host-nuclease inhibitor Gam family protein [Prevotellaceae bacterium]
MAKREKKVIVSGVTTEQMEAAFAEYSKADAQITKINADLDVKITKLREARADELTRLQDAKDKAFDVMQAFATENRDELFSKKKSIETVHGWLGFRTGTPKLKTLKGYTWNAVTKLLGEFLPRFVRTSEEPAKDLLLAERENPDVADLFPKVGIWVDQDETFYVERKSEDSDNA